MISLLGDIMYHVLTIRAEYIWLIDCLIIECIGLDWMFDLTVMWIIAWPMRSIPIEIITLIRWYVHAQNDEQSNKCSWKDTNHATPKSSVKRVTVKTAWYRWSNHDWTVNHTIKQSIINWQHHRIGYSLVCNAACEAVLQMLQDRQPNLRIRQLLTIDGLS